MPVLVGSRCRRPAVHLGRVRTLAQRILIAVGKPKAELSIACVGDRRMQRLNRQYRRRDGPTDVLAFPMRGDAFPTPSLLGDVIISLPTAARQASRHGHSVERELAVLLVHGVLHLCGYDHERSVNEAKRMHRKEQAVLRVLGRIPTLVIRT